METRLRGVTQEQKQNAQFNLKFLGMMLTIASLLCLLIILPKLFCILVLLAILAWLTWTLYAALFSKVRS